MSQKIKKQIKRSMPLLLIFSLLWSTMAVGLVFNFDFNIYKDNKLDLSLESPVALADTATTSVSVLNAAPYFSVGPFELPFSTDATPINVGENITFTTKADDPELDDYYLLVCGDDTVSFWAVDPDEVQDLIKNLQDFSKHLPRTVIESGNYTE